MCTVDRKKLKVHTMKADGTGAYTKKGNVKKYYHYFEGSCNIAHKNPDGSFYINTRIQSNANWSKKHVNSVNVYRLMRQYRHNKNNNLSHLIAEIENSDGQLLDYYYVLYRWQGGDDNSEDFALSRHGNSIKPFQGTVREENFH